MMAARHQGSLAGTSGSDEVDVVCWNSSLVRVGNNNAMKRTRSLWDYMALGIETPSATGVLPVL